MGLLAAMPRRRISKMKKTLHLSLIGASVLVLLEAALVSCQMGLTPPKGNVDIQSLASNGSLNICISWPAGTFDDPRLSSTLAPPDGGGFDLPFTVAADGLSATATASLEQGDYVWNLELYDGNVKVFCVTDTVRTFADFSTDASLQLAAGGKNQSGKLQLTFTPRMDSPIGISLAGQLRVLSFGESMTVAATPAQSVDWYQWYLNGNPVSGATSSRVAVGPTLAPDYYRLTVMVGKRNVLSSATAEFDVIPEPPFRAFGTKGNGVGHFCGPVGVAVDSSGRIYVADAAGNRIVRVNDMSGAGWTSYGSFGSGIGRFSGPAGIALDSSGRIYVSDVINNRIVRIDDMTGSGWISYGGSRSGPGQFLGPAGVAVDACSRIYVSDVGNSRIIRINDMSGAGWTALGSFGNGVAQFSIPGGIALDPSGHIYVADSGNSRLVRMEDMSGAGWTAFGSRGSGAGQFNRPYGIALDASGRIYAVDSSNSRLVRMNDMSGSGWLAYGNQGGGAEQFTYPGGIAIDSNCRIYVADTGNSRITDFSLP
jgi:sugar lactone lactonase YvrE